MIKKTKAMIVRLAFISFCLVTFISAAPRKLADGNFELIVLHNNDMHARFEQASASGSKCGVTDAANNKCYGGFARVAHVVREYRAKATAGEIPSVLFLNAGDTYTGTPWFAIYKDVIAAKFLEALKPDAISLGNHEFDEGSENLAKFLNEIDFPVLAANLDLSKEPQLRTPMLMPSKVFTIEGRKVGVIGYLTPETKQFAQGNEVEFIDEIVALNEEAQKLKDQGVNIIIALGHSGLERDKQIAAQCPDIDLVIGGHSHSFLYTGDVPDIDIPVSEYPTTVTQQSGKKVPVLQAYAYTKYLGKIHLEFNESGDLVEYDGTPILLNKDIPRDADVVALLEEYRPAVDALENEIIGNTKVYLDGDCRFHECNLGNFITDAMVDWRSQNYHLTAHWTDTAIGLLQSGGVRASISHLASNGEVTMGDAKTVLPFENKMVIIEVTGAELRSALEHSVYRYDGSEGRGEFLQMSGIQVVYDLNLPTGQRVVDVKVLCADCDVPQLQELDDAKLYKIVTVDFLAEGGDGFTMFEGKTVETFEVAEVDAVVEYFKKKSPVHPAVEWRITIKKLTDPLEEVVGRTIVTLDSNCQQNECNLGNFIADSMVDYHALNYNANSYWTDASIALIQGSRIKSSITNGDIKRSDANKIFEPAFNNLNIATLTGAELVKMLEFSIKNRAVASNVEFLQVSGLQVTYDMNKPEGQRVTDTKVLCAQCDVPTLEPLKLEQEYKVIMQAILASGADGFGEVLTQRPLVDLEESDVNVFINYLKKKTPVHPAVEWRITFIEESVEGTTSPTGPTDTPTNPIETSTEAESTTLGASSLQISFALILLTSLVSIFCKK